MDRDQLVPIDRDQCGAMTGIADRCARAANGHAAAPPSSVMNWRRLMHNMGLSPGRSETYREMTGRSLGNSESVLNRSCNSRAVDVLTPTCVAAK
jgi:hypothetical protein